MFEKKIKAEPFCMDPPVLVASSYFLDDSGSGTLMRNLLSAFYSQSVVLACDWRRRSRCRNKEILHDLHPVMLPFFTGSRIDILFKYLQVPFATELICRLATINKCKIICGTYPNIFLFAAAFKAAKRLSLPFVAYLHDTIAAFIDKCSNDVIASWCVDIRKDVFNNARHIFVMSEGMRELYKNKYSLTTETLLHSYPEEISYPPSFAPDNFAFWSGNIYKINSHSFERVISSFTDFSHLKVLLTTNQDTIPHFKSMDNRISKTFFSDRSDYLATLRKANFLILCLDWPDECDVPHDELSTIFPTKTIEYLASGRPIIVHCPKEYYLARFFLENRCGEVVSDRSKDSLSRSIKRLLLDKSLRDHYVRNGLRVAKRFELFNVAKKLYSRLISFCD